MPGPYDCRAWFRDRAYAWSEHYLYLPNDDLGPAVSAFQQLLVARVALHNPGVQLYSAQVRDSSNHANRAVWNPLIGSPQFGLPPVIPPNNWPLADNPYSAVLVTLQTGTGPNGRLFMSGLPDAYIFDQVFDPPDAWRKVFQVFVEALTAAGVFGKLVPKQLWGIRGRNKDTATHPLRPLTAATGGIPMAFTTAAQDWARGDRVQLTGSLWRDPIAKVNRIYRVLEVAAGVTTVDNAVQYSTLWLGGGALQLVASDTFFIVNAEFNRPVRHKRGVGYEPARGRAPNR